MEVVLVPALDVCGLCFYTWSHPFVVQFLYTLIPWSFDFITRKNAKFFICTNKGPQILVAHMV